LGPRRAQEYGLLGIRSTAVQYFVQSRGKRDQVRRSGGLGVAGYGKQVSTLSRAEEATIGRVGHFGVGIEDHQVGSAFVINFISIECADRIAQMD